MFRFDRFEALRVSKGISKKHIADAIGRSAQIIQDWKNPKKTVEPNDKQLKIVAEILGTTPEYLLGVVDEYGLSDKDWRMMGVVYKERREKAGIEAKDACDGDVIDHSHLVGFELLGLRLTLQQLDVICGMIGTTAPDVFALWADKLWGKMEKPTNIDKDALEYAQAVHDRPELKTLFKIGKKATPEKLGAILALLEDRDED